MRDLLQLFTPPEWFDWNLAGKLAYVVVYAAVMIPVVIFARWFSALLFR